MNIEKLTNVGVLYYLRERRDVHEDWFEPVSKSQWRLLREMSPGKSSKSYKAYLEDCNDRYLDELERRKKGGRELTTVGCNLNTLNGVEDTKKMIIKIQEEEGFINWANTDIIEKLLNL